MGILGNPLLGVLQAADGQDWTEVFTSCKENPTEGLVMFLALDLALLHWTAQGPAGVSHPAAHPSCRHRCSCCPLGAQLEEIS